MKTPNLMIRKANPNDFAALTEVVRSVEYFTHMIEVPLEEAERIVSRGLNRDLASSEHSILVAEDMEGKILGYAAVHWLPYLFLAGPEGYVSELFIHKEARGLGIGGLLLDAIKEEARQLGCARLYLLNGRQRESYRRDFYKKNGWRERDMASFVFDI